MAIEMFQQNMPKLKTLELLGCIKSKTKRNEKREFAKSTYQMNLALSKMDLVNNKLDLNIDDPDYLVEESESESDVEDEVSEDEEDSSSTDYSLTDP